MKDIHQIEYMFEILTRSPHNRYDVPFLLYVLFFRSLLRYNHFETILQKWMIQRCKQLSLIASGDVTLMEDTFLSLSHILHIIYNFFPTLDRCSWLTIQGAFSSTATNILNELNKPFGELPWYVIISHFSSSY